MSPDALGVPCHHTIVIPHWQLPPWVPHSSPPSTAVQVAQLWAALLLFFPGVFLASEAMGQVRSDMELTLPGSIKPVIDGCWCINTPVPSLLKWDNAPIIGGLPFPVSHLQSFPSISCILRYYLHLDPFFMVCSWGNLNMRTLVLDTRGNTGGDLAIRCRRGSGRSMSESQSGACLQMFTFSGRDLGTVKFSDVRDM